MQRGLRASFFLYLYRVRLLFILLIWISVSQSSSGQMIFINGKMAKRTVDTIKQDKDTLWIKAKWYSNDALIQTSIIKGRKYSSVYRPWYRVLGRGLIPKARVRDEGILISNEERTLKGKVIDSTLYLEYNVLDSIKVNNQIIWSKPKKKPGDLINLTCGQPVFQLLSTPLKKERKKKKRKQRRK